MASKKMNEPAKMSESLNRSHGSLKRTRTNKINRKFSHKYDLVKNGTHVHGWVTYVDDPFNFYIRFNDWNTDQYSYMMAELQDEIASLSPSENIVEGHPYAARFNGQWCRGFLEEITTNEMGVIFFVDSGHREIFNLGELRDLHERYLSLPAQASLCQLGCVTITKTNLKSAAWPAESCIFFREVMEVDSYANIFVVGCYVGEVGRLHKKESKLYVTVYLDDDETSVNSKLTAAGHGFSVQAHEEIWHKVMRVMPRPPTPTSIYKSVSSSNYNNTRETPEKPPAPPVARKLSTTCTQVSVGRIVDPGKFFVYHLSKEVHTKQQVLIQRTCPNLPKPHDISIGNIYAVVDEQSHQWYRGNCMHKLDCLANSSEVAYDFWLIDEGYNMQIPASCIRQLSEDLKVFRPMIWECSLHMKKPSGGWTLSLIELFRKLVNRQQLQMTVFSLTEGIRRVDLAQLPEYSGESAVASIKEALVAADCEKLSTVTPPAVPPKPVARRYFSHLSSMKKGACLHGNVVHVSDPDGFYVRFDISDAEKFSQFDVQLQKEYNGTDARNSHSVGVPKKGFPYVVCHNGVWYRGLVEDIVTENQVSVFLVDVGLRVTASSGDLLQILDKYLIFPVQVTLCKLYGVCAKAPSGFWSTESKLYFRQMLLNVRVTAYVEGYVPGQIGKVSEGESLLSVVLYKGNDGVSLNTEFTESGYGISVRQLDLANHSRVREESKLTDVASNESNNNTLLAHDDSSTGTLPSPMSLRKPQDRPTIQIRVTTPQDGSYDVSDVQSQAQPRKISLDADCCSDVSTSSSRPSSSNLMDNSDDSHRPFCSSAASPYRYNDLSIMDTSASKSDNGEFDHISDRSVMVTTQGAAQSDETAVDSLAAEVSALESVKITGSMPREGDYVVAVKFLMCQSPDAIYVRPLPYESKYEEMQAKLQQAYKSTKVYKARSVYTGMRCAAFVYGQWIRAVVVEYNENLDCYISSMDTGQPHQVTMEQICQLVEPFASIPKLAVKCSLVGVAPVNGVWDSDLVLKITQALLGADEIFITCHPRPKAIPSTMAVNIVYGQTHPNGKTLTNLNEKLLAEKGISKQLVPFNNNKSVNLSSCNNISRCCSGR